jgi:hypothetical protein
MYDRYWRILTVAPTVALCRSSPIRRAGLEWQLRVEGGRSHRRVSVSEGRTQATPCGPLPALYRTSLRTRVAAI